MSDAYRAALTYLEKGLSVIPVSREKKPLTKWVEFQSRYPTGEEIATWFREWPDANVGIVTGKISNLTVIDCDSQEAIEFFRQWYHGETPRVKTPKGMHYYFQYQEGVRNTARLTDHIDVRSEGGYVVAPPSMNGEGVAYSFIKDFALSLDSFNNCFLYKEYVDKEKGVSTDVCNIRQKSTLFEEGRRDEDLFHVANCMVKGHAEPEYIHATLRRLMLSWGEVDEKWVKAKIESATQRARRRERNLAAEVEEWVLSTTGNFLSTETAKCLQTSTREEQKNLSIALKRLSERKPPLIEKVPGRNGHWRRIDTDIEYMDFVNVSKEGAIDLALPLGIHKKTIFFPKNVIVVAGVTGHGKTSFLLNVMRGNMDKFQWKYFMSEMSDLALNYKLTRFNWPIDAWKMDVIPDYVWDYNNIQDKIFPNAMNVIDYLEPEGEKSYSIHDIVTKIIKKLDKGMALIATQKKPGVDLSAGGVYSAKAASLYLSLDWGTINIFKNRFREEDKFPLRTRKDFNLEPGQHFSEKGGWYDPNEKKRAIKAKGVVDDDFIHEE